ncbi:hypothetical protein AAG906_041033 [Vitis piasezkii]
MDEKDWFDPWPLMNFSPVSFWIHSNVMVSLFTAFLSFAPSLLIAIPLLLVLPLGLPQFAAVATVNEQIKVWLAVFGRLGQQLALHKRYGR